MPLVLPAAPSFFCAVSVRPLRLVHMVSAIGHEASGPSYSVPRLCQALAARGHDVELHVLDWEDTRSVPLVGLRMYTPLRLPQSMMFSLPMGVGLRRAAATADVVHSHGLWMVANLQAAHAAMSAHKPLVTSPRGTFAAWAMAQSSWKKRALWFAGQRRAVQASALLHATSEAELADIRRMGLDAPVTVIPNGIDIANAPRALGARRTLLFLARLHPGKGLELLLHAWAKLEASHPDWDLQIVGRSAGAHEVEMQALARQLGLARVTFAGPLYGSAKSAAYARADLYVLPTHTENFGVTVAEALSAGVPVIVTKGAPWSGVETERCGWWIERNDAALTGALANALSMDRGTLTEMGARGQAWMSREFGWDGIADRMESAYRWVLRPERTSSPLIHQISSASAR